MKKAKKAWYVDYLSVETVLVEDAETMEEAIAKAQRLPAALFQRMESQWTAEEAAIT